MASQRVHLWLLLCVPLRLLASWGTALQTKDKVSILSQRFQQILFQPENYQLIYDMREVFFPSSNYRFWKADDINIIDIEVCLDIQEVSPVYACENIQKDIYHKCRTFQWTDSHFIYLIDIHQLYSFDLLTTGALYGTIAHSHLRRYINISLNVTCDKTLDSLDETLIDRALIQFLSWSKQYARYSGLTKPSSWDEKEQGFVTRKYDYVTIDLQLFDNQSQLTFFLTQTCFILCNIMAMYLLPKHGRLMYSKLASYRGFGSSAIKGLSVTSTLLSLSYTIGVPVIHYTSNFLTVLCDQTHNLNEGSYKCIPENRFDFIHRKQVLSLVTKYCLLLLASLVYALASIHIVTTATTGYVVFKHRYLRWVEAYVLWSVLMGVHILVGFASLPLLIFTILTPMYMIFYLSAWIIGLGLIQLPFAALFHIVGQVRKCEMNAARLALWIVENTFVYLVGTGILFNLLFLYYLFLAGGASLNGVKGALFSLLPPTTISVVAFVLKWKASKSGKLKINDIAKTNSDITKPSV